MTAHPMAPPPDTSRGGRRWVRRAIAVLTSVVAIVVLAIAVIHADQSALGPAPAGQAAVRTTVSR